MNNAFRDIRAVGFDLDGTMYAQSPLMDEKIVQLFAEKVLAKKPELGTIAAAKEFSEKKYRELESRKKTLELVGYSNAGEIMEGIFREADSAQFLERDEKLIGLLHEIRKAKEYVYLVTTAPADEMEKKLARLGVKKDIFNLIVNGNDPHIAQKPKDGNVFSYVVEQSGIPAGNHVYIGDREKSDILAPQSIGMRTIAVANEIPAADAYVPDVYGIREILL
ncbi:MAG TPA: HAD family hydrolase [Candidatus Paceibacterota bacterium]|nr:HAD family hydrolase [Candidatus Paceibacterota bacterium]